MKKYLVVDESSATRKIARGILEKMGFHVTEAEDGMQALAICRRSLPNAILLDWNMRIMDGYEFLGELLNLPGGDKTTVVFCTAEGKAEQRAGKLNAGARKHFARPFDRDIITAKLRDAGLFTFTVFSGSGATDLLDFGS